ncbi:MAG: hypothetical protein E4H14_18895 [Candidatus Thorarchaeota archaeon]|nr:MAG: hypothetical protein E4H14_18895 [Candidatus Thorarchaeota archaeon]
MFRKSTLLSLMIIFTISVSVFNSNYTLGTTQLEMSNQNFLIASESTIWHNDCSNITGWSIVPNPQQVRLDGIQDDVDILSDESAIHSSLIPYAEGRWHGSMFLFELETPVYIGHGLNFEVELNHPGSTNYMGGIEVGLYDRYQNISYWVSIVDSWTSLAFSTDLGYGDGGVNSVHTTSRSGSLQADYRIWHNETINTIQGQDDHGIYNLTSEFEHEREIHYVGIMFWNVESYNYESKYVLDILVEGAPIITTTTSTTTVTNTTSITNTTGSLIGFEALAISISSIGVIIIVVAVICRSKSQGPGTPSGTGYQW